MRIVVGAMGPGRVALVDPAVSDTPFETMLLPEFPGVVRELESARRPRWIWADTRRWYPRLLAEGVRVERCHDLVLASAILDHSTATAAARDGGMHPRPEWLPLGPAEAGQPIPAVPAASVAHSALFDLLDFDDETDAAAHEPATGPRDVLGVPVDAVLDEHARQLALVAASERPGALRLLLAAESAGALIGAELHAAGLPWHRGVHERVLETELGPKPAPGRKPARMEELASEVRTLLGAPAVNLDSQVDLLKALRRAGIQVESTSRWELREHEHPAIEPLVAYKKLARLHSANAWSWLDEWVVDGRFRPDYVPGGTATGRWATSGGGALQLPKNVRSAVVADPGWSLVVADAAQLEPRVLAGLAHDEAMAAAGRGRDFYNGIVGAGVVETRDQAKVAILGAMYGATTGESGRLVPRLARAYPRAMALVDRAAAEGSAVPASRPCSVGRRRCRAPSGAPRNHSHPSPTRPRPTSDVRARVRVTGAGSPGTSWCRAPLRSGRSAGWPASARSSWRSRATLRRRVRSPLARGPHSSGCPTSSTTCTTRSSCTRLLRSPTTSPPRS